MDRTEQAEFAAAVMAMAEVFDIELSPVKVEMYFLALQSHSILSIKAAIVDAIRARTFFPKPAELLEILEGSAEDHAELAWVRWQKLALRVGAYQSVDISDDPALAETLIALFGSWPEACRMTTDEGAFRHAEFRRLYRALRTRDLGAARGRLCGIHELTNRATAGGLVRIL